MERFSIADARDHLDEIIDRVQLGEQVEITREGQTVATLTGVPKPKPRKPIDLETLRALTADMPYQEQGAGEFIRWMRDTARY